MARDQAEDAQALYDNRATTYDDSHHPRFARHMVELACIQPGEHVLDLACGTGLVTFLAASAVGAAGKVTGVDISTGMLAEASAKKAHHSVANVQFYNHSMTSLSNLRALGDAQGAFDCITCCSALVLLEYPTEAMKEWSAYLKPGGRLVVDATHIQNLTPGVVFERVGRRMGRPLPWYRLNFPGNDSLEKAMFEAGLRDVQVTFLSQLTASSSTVSEELKHFVRPVDDPKILREYSIDDADEVFSAQIGGTAMKTLAAPEEVREEARRLFREEWGSAADEDGMVREVDGIFVGVGYKT